jgi:hypothetical protein
VLRGGRPIEILYAVYHFAERSLGFCFFEPGHDRLTPSGDIDLCDGTVLSVGAAAIANRGLIQEFPFTQDNWRLADWMAKNRLNYLLVWMKYYDQASPAMREHYQVRGITIESGHHNFDYWIPARNFSP